MTRAIRRLPVGRVERPVGRMQASIGTAGLVESLVEEIIVELTMSENREKQEPAEASVQAAPSREIEIQVKKNPDDEDAKVDLGSDESMDASDPSAASQPGSTSEPVPSSSFPEKDADK